MTSFNYEKIKNPMVYKENTLPAHSDYRIYKNRAEFLENRSSLVYSLDGIWKFSYAVNAASAIPGFEEMDYDCRSWADIRVPAHIQLEGYDRPQYVDVQYPWDGWEDVRPGGVPERFNPVASYVKYFELPKGMKGKEIRIAFEGVESGMALWLNGSYVGYSEDSFTPSDFELTPYLREGENKLAVQVYKWTSSSWCEDQDFFRFSGIHRSVYLYEVPSIHLEDIGIKTLFPEDNFSKAVLEVQAKVKGEGKVRFALMEEGEGRLPSPSGAERGVPLDLEEEGKKIFERTESAWEARMMAGIRTEQDKKEGDKKEDDKEENRWKEILIREEIPAPKLWSAEIPYLYRLEIELCSMSGDTEEYVEEMVGIRKFEMKNNRMLLNGKRIVFKGVNRQEFSSVTGRCASYEELEKDIVTMKRNNINAVRTSHYSNSRAIYDLCDRYGLYMIAECNMESHGTWDAYVKGLEDESYVLPGAREEWEGMMLDRVNSCYQKDKNHPSVLIWSCGNESFGGRTIYRMSELFRELDDTRLVHYEGICEDRRYPDTSDMESRMYRPVSKIKEYLETPDVKPYICCEYSHAMGNSCGAMHKYTDLADEENSGYQGGFLWDYIDQSLYKKDRYGKEFQAYGGDFHDRPNNGNFSGNGIVYGGERNISPKMQEVKYNYQNISVIFHEDGFEVWNKNLFTSTDAFACQAVLQRDGVAVSQRLLNISVEPGSRKRFPHPFEIPQKETLWREGEYAVTISFLLKEDTLWAKAGHEVAFGQAVIAELKSEGNAGDVVKQPILIRGKNNIGVRGEEFQALFSMNGGLVSYRYAGEEMLEKMPKPNFWRAPVDNDEGNNMAGRYAQWKLASLYLTAKGIGKEREALAGIQYDNPEVTEEADCVAIAYRYRFQTTPEGECQVTYRVYGDGRIRTTLSYDPVKELGDMPEFGMIFYCNADYDYVEWYGNGPAETYEDRKMGAKLGIYRNRVQDNMAEYLVPQECGNKTDVRYGKIMDRKGRGLLFTGDKMNFSALPYTPHEMEQAAHPYELPQIHYTVVRVSMQQMGVGGDNSWGALVHPEYLIDIGKKLEFTFTFRGI